jgi:hypothetical protein
MATKPALTIALQSIKCLEETDEVGADEPYVLVTGVNLQKLPPQVEVTKYGPWSDVDQGEVKSTKVLPDGTPPEVIEWFKNLGILRVPFWGLDNESPKIISDPDDVIFIVSVMENDDGSPKAARELVKAAAVATLASSVGMDRDNKVKKLIADIKSVLAMPTGAPNFDDHIGTKELRLTAKDLYRVIRGPIHRDLFFTGDGGHYKATFKMLKG